MPTLRDLAPKRGRPRKFRAPSRAVTLTLPEDVLAALRSVDRDVGQAIVRLALPEMGRQPHPPAELVTFGRRAVIVVNRTQTLEEQTGITLIPLPDGRALISFDEPLTVATFELRIQDALDGHQLPAQDLEVFQAIRDLLKDARRSGDVHLEQRQIIMLESGRAERRSRTTASASPRRSRPSRPR
jgi:hypothetical protein